VYEVPALRPDTVALTAKLVEYGGILPLPPETLPPPGEVIDHVTEEEVGLSIVPLMLAIPFPE
jgi:hypothetical protein